MCFSGLKCGCGKPLATTIYVKSVDDTGGGVFIASKASLIITDDLQVLPNKTGFAVQIFRNLGITDTVGIEERSLNFGFNEIMDLLKGSLASRAPFTELILDKKQINHLAMKCAIDVPPVNLIKKQIETFGGEMIVKAIVSDNKLLFAEVDGDFVDFLFSLLALPLGGVEWLLDCDSLTNIDNLYKSVSNMGMNKYLKNIDKMKAQLLQPKLPLCYYSRTRFLSPNFHNLYFSQDSLNPDGYGSQVKCYKFPEGEVEYGRLTCLWVLKYWKAKYVKGQTMYMVTDDLTVTPLSSATGLSVLNNLKIPLSNVEELELVVGLEEALSILKASLTSSRAITDGLITPFLMKQPKQEG